VKKPTPWTEFVGELPFSNSIPEFEDFVNPVDQVQIPRFLEQKPVDIFFAGIQLSMFQRIVEYTNASGTIFESVKLKKDPQYYSHHPAARRWVNVSDGDILQWFGSLFLLHSRHCSSVRDGWKTDFVHDWPKFRELAGPLWRFQQISSALMAAPPSDEFRSEPWSEIRTLIDHIGERMKMNVKPGKILGIDEMSIKSFHSNSDVNQQSKHKKVSMSVDTKLLSDKSTGCVLAFHLNGDRLDQFDNVGDRKMPITVKRALFMIDSVSPAQGAEVVIDKYRS
jgi:hypothetical protein